MEYDLIDEFGFVDEKQIALSCSGILSKNNFVRALCGRFIRNGEHIFDVLSRYEYITTYVLMRNDMEMESVMKMVFPFLKAYGVTDSSVYSFVKDTLMVAPKVFDVIQYLRCLMPTYIMTRSLIHYVMRFCECTGFRFDDVFCTHIDFDTSNINRQEGRRIREIASRISTLRIPKISYIVSKSRYLDADDAAIVSELDKDLHDIFSNMSIGSDMKNIEFVGSNEKIRQLLEIRRRNRIDLDSTIYIGSDASDYQTLDLVRASEGLAISFNGGEYSIRGSNVMILSDDVSVVNIFASEFYNEGIERVYDLIDNWNLEKLRMYPCFDKNLANAILKAHPRKLPIVKRITRSNIGECIIQGEDYNRKMKRMPSLDWSTNFRNVS
ncbi:MAG: hypothetical protein MJY64_00675 [archaeon]|nr:hypothetical protein [archaeon]